MTENPYFLYALEEPRRIRAGRFEGTEIFFDCGECIAKAPEIYGFIAKSPYYDDIMVKRHGEIFYPAFLCEQCFKKYGVKTKTTIH